VWIQGGSFGAQCEQLEISSLPWRAVKTNMPDNWRRRRSAPIAIESPAIKAYNRQVRRNRFDTPGSERFAWYV
jgi:hypothetical protein